MKNSLSNLYTTHYNNKIEDLEANAIEILNAPNGKKNAVKIQRITSEVHQAIRYFTEKRVSENELLPDLYTEALFKAYDRWSSEYEQPAVDEFVKDHLDKLKFQFKGMDLPIPEHLAMNAQQTLILIAHRKALLEFAERLNKIKECETLDIVIARIMGTYVETKAKQAEATSDTGETEIVGEEGLTTRQQVLFFHYIFKALEVNNVAQKTKARVINKFISRNFDSVYDAVRDPHNYNSQEEFKKNMREVSKLFEILKLPALSTKVLEDIEKN